MDIKRQKFLILGASKSGFSVAKYLQEKGATFYVYEELKTQKAIEALEKLKSLGVTNLSRDKVEETLKECEILVLSPGVPINHEIAVKAKAMGKRIMGELEFAYCTFLPLVVGVTGTNGKTTTVTLINGILEKAGVKSQLVGNVGTPFTEKLNIIDNETVCVTEVSSYQLESVNYFCPHISCVLNIAPDHLERHYSMENYIYLKKRIFKNQRESEYAILNFDDITVKNFFADVKAKVYWVSLKGKVDGAYRKDGKLYCFDEYVIDEEQLKIKGEHNVYNVLFAILTAKLLGVLTQSIVDFLIEFKGVNHRIQFVKEKNGVEYYNDSKATNTASTISALASIKKPMVLILGGSEKGEDYNELFEVVKQSPVRHVILTGDSKFNMLESAGKMGVNDITLTADFNYAVMIASVIAKEGDCVLLSPSCASFDKFNSFEERGEAFIKAVEEL